MYINNGNLRVFQMCENKRLLLEKEHSLLKCRVVSWEINLFAKLKSRHPLISKF